MWSGKRYHSLNHHLRATFGEKVMKISLDGGFSCPNRDGTISRAGCLFCSEEGSGDFAGDRRLSISDQFGQVQTTMNAKWARGKYIAYFQAFTNTYDTIDHLRAKYDEAMAMPGVVGLAIATRPDCLDEAVVRLIAGYAQKGYVWVELGLQTASDKTGRLINRGYDRVVYEEAMARLSAHGIPAVTHIIFGLPGETDEDMLESVRYASDRGSAGVKFHLLHLMRHTPMEALYDRGELVFLDKARYVDLICRSIALLDPGIVIHRLTGDAPRDLLIGPLWSLKKWEILNDIDAELERRGITQGSMQKERKP